MSEYSNCLENKEMKKYAFFFLSYMNLERSVY